MPVAMSTRERLTATVGLSFYWMDMQASVIKVGDSLTRAAALQNRA